MAIAYARPQIISRTDGRSAVACAAYRAGEKLEDERQGKTQDYDRRGGVLADGILLPANAPDWMRNRGQLWNAVERREDRSTRPDEAQLAREFVIALPHELDGQAREYLVKNILKEGATRKGMVADYALHGPDRKGDHRNHHAHVMLTMRRIDAADADGFGNKAREWNSRKELETFKDIIERETNRMLERHGIREKITFVLQPGQEPQRHMGENASALEQRGVETEVGKANRAIADRNRELAAARAQLAETAHALAREDALTWEPDQSPSPGRFEEANAEASEELQAKRAARLAATLYDRAGMASQQRDALRDLAERQRRHPAQQESQTDEPAKTAVENKEEPQEHAREERQGHGSLAKPQNREMTDQEQRRQEKIARFRELMNESESLHSQRNHDGRGGDGSGGGGRTRER